MLFLYALLCVAISAAASTSLFDTTSSLFIPSSRSQRRSFPVIAIRSGDSASGGYRRPTLSTAGLDDAASDPGHASRPSSPNTEIASTKSSPVHPKPEWKPTSPGPYKKNAGFDDTASVDRFPIHIPSTGPPPARTLSLNRGTLPEIKPPPPPKDSKSRKSVVPFFQQKTNERKAQQQSQKQDLKPSQPEIGVQPPQHGGTFFHKLAAKAAERNKPKPPPQPETGGHPPGAPQRGANIFQKLAAQAAGRNKPPAAATASRPAAGANYHAPVTGNTKSVDVTGSRGGRKANKKPNAGPTAANDNGGVVKSKPKPVTNSGQNANAGRNKLKKPGPPKTEPGTGAGPVTKSSRQGGKTAPVANGGGGQGANPNSRRGRKRQAKMNQAPEKAPTPPPPEPIPDLPDRRHSV